ncbi:MAG: hypothetical protein NTX59_10900 [Elusimicrobia bacterium]|nr:hypothetical protein [Elusimicrobiota bacterium]
MKNTINLKKISVCFCFFSQCLISVDAFAGLPSKNQLNQAVPTHGNYCGSGWSNGKWNPSGGDKDICKTGIQLLPPKDEVDKLCVAHDKDYCSSDKAKEDDADKQLIDGLTLLKPSLQKEWADNGCAEMGAPVDLPANNGAKTGQALMAAIMNLVKKSVKKTEKCQQLKSELAYTDAAIPALKVKRALYQKTTANLNPAFKTISIGKSGK